MTLAEQFVECVNSEDPSRMKEVAQQLLTQIKVTRHPEDLFGTRGHVPKQLAEMPPLSSITTEEMWAWMCWNNLIWGIISLVVEKNSIPLCDALLSILDSLESGKWGMTFKVSHHQYDLMEKSANSNRIEMVQHLWQVCPLARQAYCKFLELTIQCLDVNTLRVMLDEIKHTDKPDTSPFDPYGTVYNGIKEDLRHEWNLDLSVNALGSAIHHASSEVCDFLHQMVLDDLQSIQPARRAIIHHPYIIGGELTYVRLLASLLPCYNVIVSEAKLTRMMKIGDLMVHRWTIGSSHPIPFEVVLNRCFDDPNPSILTLRQQIEQLHACATSREDYELARSFHPACDQDPEIIRGWNRQILSKILEWAHEDGFEKNPTFIRYQEKLELCCQKTAEAREVFQKWKAGV